MKKIIIPVIAVVLVGAALTVYLQDPRQEMQSGEELTSDIQPNTNDISWQQAAAQLPKNEILENLREDPLFIKGTTKLFIYSEAMSDSQVSEALQDSSFRVDCCQYFTSHSDLLPENPESLEHMFISITFFDFQKEKIVIAVYSLGDGDIGEVQVQNMIRPGMKASSLQYMERFPDNAEFLSKLITADSKPNTALDTFECTGWCNQKELEDNGCTKPMIEYLYKYTNLLDDDFAGQSYGSNPELPEGVSYRELDLCDGFIYDKRTSDE